MYFIPIVTWLWNRLGVDVICFMPFENTNDDIPNKQSFQKLELIEGVVKSFGGKLQAPMFYAPDHKQATYSQCLRNYAACLDLPENELLVTSDVDMALFKIPDHIIDDKFSIFGFDLVPQRQYPQCYVTAPTKAWREAFNLHGKTYQQAIDDLLGEDECEHYRGCRWSVDQEQSFLNISPTHPNLLPRARQGTQFADKRYDRDDSFILDRLNPDTIDFHMNRPGYEPQNFEIILKILQYHYPNDGFDWLVDFNNAYKQLL